MTHRLISQEEYDALIADRERLEWLQLTGYYWWVNPNKGTGHLYSPCGIPYFHKDGYPQVFRDAIDKARCAK